ncbi:hypothetical protein FACS189472_04890 [Alphaproteobacteria bacterium]|nr:hypothetical protein FACS189472_04890 [Alphaproteobacteria bacterium]
MLSIRLNRDIERNIEKIASKMNITKAVFLREAITEYLEDRMDYMAAVEALKETEDLEKQGFKSVYSSDEINKMYEDDLQN